MCDFQPIEKYWANIKGHIGRHYFKGRNMQWIADEFEIRSRSVNTGDLVRHAMGEMNTWIVNDDLLVGSIDY
jgi:glycerol kinase